MRKRRPFADSVEIRAPKLASAVVRGVGHLPQRVRQGVLESAFGRAGEAFNRGDLEAVFALFDAEVEYMPPPPMHVGEALHGRAAVFEFWTGVFARFDQNTIENLSLEEASPGLVVRRARLHHRSSVTGDALDYTIVQTTELRRGRVIRQANVLDAQLPDDT